MSTEKRYRGGKHREEEKDDDDEDFFDCKETLGPPDLRRKEEETQPESENHPEKTERLIETRDNAESETEGGHQEEQDHRLQDDRLQDDVLPDDVLQDDRLQDERLLDSDSEMKEEKSLDVEFDDEYLSEVEKELTDEERESRRQQSLILKEKGNIQFKARDYTAADVTYTEALVLCPVCFRGERSVLFSNRAAARLHLDLKEQAISDCTRAIELNPDYVRALLRRAELYEQTEKLDEALDDYKKVLERDPTQTSARQACMRLPQQIQEKNEKLKEEMLGKLKDVGNMILRPFGLSTNNFQVNQDQSGSYSINFVQNTHR
ncbi:tetratricopeptide repeat protein 1-like isoform X1 [Hippoglossus hippoglossus]|uniref:tetratricopeptide repeat protein 1-like isoform X1 n=1 Tax=Hippoglossus hippoglossus TaxID=8267 RepID=UPI00148B9C44|nr:tetratricopeptide repeat protein 1-like isoform X1 [Hippoglossus hippoglossus]